MREDYNLQGTIDNVMGEIAGRRNRAMGNDGRGNYQNAGYARGNFEEITLKFGRGCVGEEFQGRDGNLYREILIPNQDQNDHRPWQTFVAKSNHVHENKFGKGMWLKLPAKGHTTVRRSVVLGTDPDGKKEWGVEKTCVTNVQLKRMVEAYKERPRESVKDKLAEKKEEAALQKPSGRTQNRNRSKKAEL